MALSWLPFSFGLPLIRPRNRGQIHVRFLLVMSVNAISIEHLLLACRHVEEMQAAGITENFAIRMLELFTDVYAKRRNGGSVTPHAADDVELWSIEAKRIRRKDPNAKPRDHFRVEHGTPRRAFARMVMDLYMAENLSEASMNDLVDRKWKLAVVTLDEDRRLNKIARDRAFETPEARWAAADIKFE